LASRTGFCKPGCLQCSSANGEGRFWAYEGWQVANPDQLIGWIFCVAAWAADGTSDWYAGELAVWACADFASECANQYPGRKIGCHTFQIGIQNRRLASAPGEYPPDCLGIDFPTQFGRDPQ
jgi:hypothetical protein